MRSVRIIAITIFMLVSLSGNALPSDSPQWSVYHGKTISRIDFSGKFKVKRSILYREIDSKVGMVLDTNIVERDKKKIDGLGIFSKVDLSLKVNGDSVLMEFNLREVWTLLPLFAISRADGGYDWMVGVHERDLLGFYLTATTLYRRFEGENSYFFSASMPRAFGEDLALGFGIGVSREIDPLLVHGGRYDYHYQNRSASLSLGRRFKERLYGALSYSYSRENWRLKDGQGASSDTPVEFDYPRHTVSSGVVIGRVYYQRYFYYGSDIITSLSLIREEPYHSFRKWRFGLSGHYYYVFSRFNLACRAQYWTSSADEKVRQPYSLSGYSNVRGYEDEIERGDHFLGSNVELRMKTFETKVFYTQLAAFCDYGTIWGRFHSADDAFSNPYWSIGAGIRGAIKQFLGNIGRLDAALNTRTGEVHYYISASQFF